MSTECLYTVWGRKGVGSSVQVVTPTFGWVLIVVDHRVKEVALVCLERFTSGPVLSEHILTKKRDRVPVRINLNHPTWMYLCCVCVCVCVCVVSMATHPGPEYDFPYWYVQRMRGPVPCPVRSDGGIVSCGMGKITRLPSTISIPVPVRLLSLWANNFSYASQCTQHMYT